MPRLPVLQVAVAAFFAVAPSAFGGGGTLNVASEGAAAHVSESAPDGVEALVNHPLRTFGLVPVFTEWPNDVTHYAFRVESTEQINELIERLANVEAGLKQVRLSPTVEPRGLGWATSLSKGNAAPILFSLGDQQQVDQWYAEVEKPFGVMRFTATPVAVPPTLTVYVGNPAVDLGKLQIPDGVEAVAGGTPSQFHDWKLADAPERKVAKPELPPEVSKSVAAIDAFLKKRGEAAAQPAGE